MWILIDMLVVDFLRLILKNYPNFNLLKNTDHSNRIYLDDNGFGMIVNVSYDINNLFSYFIIGTKDNISMKIDSDTKIIYFDISFNTNEDTNSHNKYEIDFSELEKDNEYLVLTYGRFLLDEVSWYGANQ